MGGIEKVEFRIDSGDWMETSYSSDMSTVGSLEPIDWHIILDPNQLTEGNHQIEVKAISGNSQSLPVIVQVEGFGLSIENSVVTEILISFFSISILMGVAFLVFRKFRSNNFEEINIIDAELI